MGVAAPGSAVYEARLDLCRVCPLYVPNPHGTGRVIGAVAGALTGESGLCGHCGCACAARASTSCPLNRW